MEKTSLTRTVILYHLINLALLSVLVYYNLRPAFILGAMILFTAVFIFLTSRLINRQYEKIREITERVSRGDHTQRIPTLGVDELNELGKSINLMLGKLDNTIGHLAVHREELRLIVSTIDDALWSQTPEGRIEWANTEFNRLFDGYNPAQHQFYWEVIREPDLCRLIGEFNHDSERKVTEIQIGQHHFLLNGSYNKAAGRTVFFLQNIDAIRTAEQMKKDFIVNLAHELRTPLTAIKGFSEAMEETAKPENIRYLKIIQNHTNRLIRLIQDLQQLIRLEQGREPELQEINLHTFFDNIQMLLNPMVEEKGLRLHIDIDANAQLFWVDPYKFEQIFINLVENSLRYTDTGGINIAVRNLNGFLQIGVSDTGKGIGEQHLPRIFERFYVVNGGRDKANSGTGLGLAIVKHIVNLHQGRVTVESEIGKGTTFLITIPTRRNAGYLRT